MLNCFINITVIIRSIKRKKFDDELVESSLVKSSSRVKGPPVIEPVRCSGSEPSSGEKKKVCGKNLTFSRKSVDNWNYIDFIVMFFYLLMLFFLGGKIRCCSYSTSHHDDKPCTYHQKSEEKQAAFTYN